MRTQTHVLDYGGGNDALCATLRNNGFAAAITYDPMVPRYARRPPGKFDLVTCFETLEHLPDPAAGIALIVDCAADPGVIVYSTLTQPANFDKIGCQLVVCRPAQRPRFHFHQASSCGRMGSPRLQDNRLQRRPASGLSHAAAVLCSSAKQSREFCRSRPVSFQPPPLPLATWNRPEA